LSQRPILVASFSVLAVIGVPVVWLALALWHPVHPMEGPVAVRTVDEAIAHLQASALNGEAVDWVSARSAALATFERTTSRESLDAAMQQLVQALGEGHSLYLPADQLHAMRSETPGRGSGALAEVDESQAGTPVVRVFTFATFNAVRVAAQAAELAAHLRRMRDAGACGAVVDLRSNGGGNMWPMLQGLSPLLPQGTLLQFVDRTGHRQSVIVDARSIRLDEQPMVALDGATPSSPMPMAILIGSATASSGEIVAIALRSNPHSVLIGSRSGGLTTANTVFELGNGGAIAVSAARLVTGHGDQVSGPLRPDIEADPSAFGDAAMLRAREWLAANCHRTPAAAPHGLAH
jgi:C-terminal processing protease CtpA/Prc